MVERRGVKTGPQVGELLVIGEGLKPDDLVIVEGVLQKRDGTLSVKAERFWPLFDLAAVPSHDFR